MVRSVHSSVQTWLDNEDYVLDWLIEAPTLGLRLSTGFDDPPGTYEQRIASLPEIYFRVPPGGGVSDLVTVVLEIIDNGEGMSPSILLENVSLHSVDFEIALLPDGVTYANRLVFFTGRVSESPRFSEARGITTLVLTGPFDREDTVLPKTLVTSQAFPQALPNHINARMPMVYGTGTDVLAPLVQINTTTFTWQIADHPFTTRPNELAMFPDGAIVGKGNVFGDIAGNQTIFIIAPMTDWQWGGGQVTCYLPTPDPGCINNQAITREQDVIAQPGSPSEALGEGSGAIFRMASLTFINTENFTDINGNGYGYLGVSLTFENPAASNRLKITLVNQGINSAAAATCVATIHVHGLDASNAIIRPDLMPPIINRSSRIHDLTFTITTEVATTGKFEIFIEVLNEGGVGTAADFYFLDVIEGQFFYQPSSEAEDLFLNGGWEGREDTAGGVYTGVANAVIENPADVLASALNQELMLAFDATSFTTARGVLAGRAFTGGLGYRWAQEEQTAREWIAELAQEAGAYLFPMGNGATKIKAYEQNAAAVSAFDADTILVDNPLDSPNQWRSSFEWYYGAVTEIINHLTIRYGWNPGDRTYKKNRFASMIGSNHATESISLTTFCTLSANEYGERPEVVLAAPWIQNDADADAYLVHVIHYFAFLSIYARFLTPLSALKLEPGDFVTLDHASLPASALTTKFEVIEWVPEPDRAWIRCVLRQVRNFIEFDYFIILDQDSVPWYWYVTFGHVPNWVLAVPALAGFTGIDLDLDPTPSWLEIDANSTTYYIYPSFDGAPIVDTSPPANGVGHVGSPTVRAVSGTSFEYTVTEGEHLDLVAV